MKISFLSHRYVLILGIIFPSFMGINNTLFAQNIDLENRQQQFNIPADVMENSPVWQKWVEETPNLLDEIRNKPSFPTRLRIGYSEFPSNNAIGGISVGIEDVFIGKTPLTFSAKYATSFDEEDSQGNSLERRSVSANLNYYVLPLGGYFNIAPVVGYRSITTNGYSTDGINLGVRVALPLSPQGAADVFVTQNFVGLGSSNEVGITEITAAYAINKSLRLSTQIEWQNSIQQADSQVSVGLEWMFK
ncbi:hypothetical protein A5482_001275 [Cyanobacterium sp. IPPAS B-1200]|uniref:hypothetical protein n=1 Tax=Cyanobacterium sp. IPPAS B-1200 TaxID=1562720 RepID=UPI000852566A|nr:hypothetical protein [Cyanobacterium sp. IPPAS B-1200]OEJ79303.1 hypothetical protein A5482_00105 [Cyanobacterium sp. IPPAS B-1200]